MAPLKRRRKARAVMSKNKITKEALEKVLRSNRSKKFREDLKLLFQMFSDYKNKKYTLLSKGTPLILIATLLYILSPIDVIPDSLPFVGGLDDIAVLMYAVHTLSDELKTYKLWLATKDMRTDPALTLINRAEKHIEEKKNQ